MPLNSVGMNHTAYTCNDTTLIKASSSDSCPFRNGIQSALSADRSAPAAANSISRAFPGLTNIHTAALIRQPPLRTDTNPLNPELNPICYLLELLGAHHFLHLSRIRVKLLTFRLLMSYIYGAPIFDVSRSHTTTQHSR